MAPLQRLRERVDALHQQLSGPDSLDAADRASLESLLADVARVLERDDEAQDEARDEADSAETHESLVDQLREAAESFEEQHPSLTELVGRVADALSRLGI